MVHGKPTEMTSDKIKQELITQNLGNDENLDLSIKRIYLPKDKRFTSCIIEVTLEVKMRFCLKSNKSTLDFPRVDLLHVNTKVLGEVLKQNMFILIFKSFV